MGCSRRQFSREFKLAAMPEIGAGASVDKTARVFEMNPNLLHRWRQEFRQGQENAFAGGGFFWSPGRIVDCRSPLAESVPGRIYARRSSRRLAHHCRPLRSHSRATGQSRRA